MQNYSNFDTLALVFELENTQNSLIKRALSLHNIVVYVIDGRVNRYSRRQLWVSYFCPSGCHRGAGESTSIREHLDCRFRK